jgi:hypothetical protein
MTTRVSLMSIDFTVRCSSAHQLFDMPVSVDNSLQVAVGFALMIAKF